MKIDNRTKLTRQIKQLTIGMVCLILGGWLNNQRYQVSWADKQLQLGTDLLSPVSQNHYVFASEKAPEPTPTPVPTPSVEDEIREVFGKDADDAIKVFRCESGLKSKCNDGLNKNGSVDCGVGQINTVHGISRKWLLKPEINIRVAYQLFLEQGWNPWRSSNKCHGLLGR